MQPEKLFDLSRLKHTKSLFWLAVICVVVAVALIPLWILDSRELLGVSVWENVEFAKKVKARFFEGAPWDGSVGVVWQFEDPVTKYGILLIDYGDVCSVAAASTFDFVLPPRS